jgi:hypothetical protein
MKEPYSPGIGSWRWIGTWGISHNKNRSILPIVRLAYCSQRQSCWIEFLATEGVGQPASSRTNHNGGYSRDQ